MKKKDNRATDADVAKQNGKPRWKYRFDDYRTDELAWLIFPTEADQHAALDLVWVGSLQGVPFHLAGDGESLVVPRTAVRFFKEAGITFAHKPK
jgi:hypothetical protein